uniref:TRAM domain-containing protein n=1 Tax=Chlamydomonas leiostraca TaxID=1034604 RepID=A0A7S0RPG7_9CHLO|mmetsp:Transcript_27385/g.69666  ORF Transcript_27385/g.69666 Transcript_27385/m.69666 type:complete len:382 (+) Transcript_27385:119-1264(+)
MELATDIICGFPGETEEDWAATMALCGHYRFGHCHISQFYPRPGTPAARMKRVPTEVAKARSRELSALVDSWSGAYTHLVGTSQRVWVVDTAADGRKLVGHTKNYTQVLLEPQPGLMGSVVDVAVTAASRWSVEGTVTAWVYRCPAPTDSDEDEAAVGGAGAVQLVAGVKRGNGAGIAAAKAAAAAAGSGAQSQAVVCGTCGEVDGACVSEGSAAGACGEAGCGGGSCSTSAVTAPGSQTKAKAAAPVAAGSTAASSEEDTATSSLGTMGSRAAAGGKADEEATSSGSSGSSSRWWPLWSRDVPVVDRLLQVGAVAGMVGLAVTGVAVLWEALKEDARSAAAVAAGAGSLGGGGAGAGSSAGAIGDVQAAAAGTGIAPRGL